MPHKKKNNNNKKKIPKPPNQPKPKKMNNSQGRRGDTAPIQNLAPADGKIANKLITDKKYRDSAFTGFMKGITFGLYKP